MLQANNPSIYHFSTKINQIVVCVCGQPLQIPNTISKSQKNIISIPYDTHIFQLNPFDISPSIKF